MFNIDTGKQIEAIYKLYKIKGGKKEEKFQTTDINEAINFHKEFIKKYRIGLYMEILPQKSTFNKKREKTEI